MTDLDRFDDSDGDNSSDFCRVCRCGATPNRVLFYPCLCTGSIKYVHQDCLLQWLRHSKREFCELCKHKFAFAPIYSADMPSRLPITILLHGLLSSIKRAVYSWFHYSLVAIAWLLVVPLTACRICRSLFTGSVSSLLTLPLDMLSTENIFIDCLYGIIVVGLTLGTFVCFMWLREQIMMNGGPGWLEMRQRQQDEPLDNPQNHQILLAEAVNNVEILNNQGNILDGARNLLPNMINALVDQNGNEANFLDNDEHQDGEIIDEANNQIVPDEAAVDVIDEPINQQNNNVNVVNNNNNNDGEGLNHVVGNFNLEWGGRNGDELTWEKLIGLDGSLFFLEHVFWIVSLNTLFILIFAFCPYHIGHFTVVGFKLATIISMTKIDGLIITIIGYIIISVGLLVLHKLLKSTQFKYFEKPCHLTGLAFIIIKVGLLTILEIGVVPLLCGLWIDFCSLTMFNSTIKQRIDLFNHGPLMFLFMHWTVGVMYLFYFASMLSLIKEVLRPGVFWFLKNFNDPNFNPIQDMINQSVPRSIQRFFFNCFMFGFVIFLMVWIPSKTLRIALPGFLPYKFQNTKDSPMDYSLEILFLQVVLPMLFDGHTFFWFKALIRLWCVHVSTWLGIRSYLLGDMAFQNGDIVVNYGGNLQRVLILQSPTQSMHLPAANPTAAASVGPPIHLASQGPNGNYRPYKLPHQFNSKFIKLIAMTLLSTVVFSIVLLTLPVAIGRFLLSLAGFDIYCDLFSLLCGLCIIALLTKTAYSCYQKILRGEGGLVRFKNRVVTGMFILWKLLVFGFVVGIWIPLAMGLLINLCVLLPIRVPMDKSFMLSFWETWMFGMMHVKMWVMILWFGPRWWFRERIDLIEQEVARRENLRLKRIFRQAGPFIAAITLAVTAPYCISKTIAPIFYFDGNYVFRRVYPVMFLFSILVLIVWFQFKQLQRLYEHIKNEQYLVGQQLVNYER